MATAAAATTTTKRTYASATATAIDAAAAGGTFAHPLLTAAPNADERFFTYMTVTHPSDAELGATQTTGASSAVAPLTNVPAGKRRRANGTSGAAAAAAAALGNGVQNDIDYSDRPVAKVRQQSRSECRSLLELQASARTRFLLINGPFTESVAMGMVATWKHATRTFLPRAVLGATLSQASGSCVYSDVNVLLAALSDEQAHAATSRRQQATTVKQEPIDDTTTRTPSTITTTQTLAAMRAAELEAENSANLAAATAATTALLASISAIPSPSPSSASMPTTSLAKYEYPGW